MKTTRRVLIFVDSDNIFLTAQSFNRKLDWHKLRDYLADSKEGRELIEMVIYIGLPPNSDRWLNSWRPSKNPQQGHNLATLFVTARHAINTED